MSFYIDEALVVAGVPLEELPLPDGAAVALIVRGNALVPPRPGTALQAGRPRVRDRARRRTGRSSS